jgi:hypothetical protein
MGEAGFLLLIDVTLGGLDVVRDLMKTHRVPYFNFDFSIQSFVKTMEMYLKAREATDVVLIAQDPTASYEALHNFIRPSSLRVMIVNPNDVGGLLNLKPAPNYFAVIADTVNVKGIFRNVSHNLYRNKYLLLRPPMKKHSSIKKIENIKRRIFFDLGSRFGIISTFTRQLDRNVH